MSEQNSGEIQQEAAAPIDTVQSEPQDSGESRDSKMVPLEALQAERELRQSKDDELKVMRDHISLMQSHQPKPKEEFDGLDDGDVLTVGEGKKMLSQIQKQHQMSLDEMKMVQKNPDYQDVVSKHLPEILKQNPGLRKTLQDSQDYELAYYLAKNSEGYKSSSKKMQKNADAERIVKNSQEAGSLSSVGTTSPVNQARKYKDMSDSDFKSMVNRNMGGI